MKVDVAIVGGGFSGTMLAAQLARRGLSSALIEKQFDRAGEGTAFSTKEAAHLLNVRTSVMSAWPDKLDDFEEWLTERGVAIGGFVERRLFGAYLKEQLRTIADVQFSIVAGEAVWASRDGDRWRVMLDDGRAVKAKHLALAHGNQPPQPLGIAGLEQSALVADDPWSDEGRALAEAAARGQVPVLIVGTGLTMVDMVLTLEAAGHDAPVTAVSRRGLMPRAHHEVTGEGLDGSEAPTGLAELWRWVRARVAAGDDWRARVDSLRPRTAELWRAMSEAERRRFMRHARPWWDVHRHRIAPQVSAQLKQRISRGTLEVMAGRIRGGEERDGEAVVTIARRDGAVVERRAALVMNCTGPLGNLAKTRDPLLRDLLDQGAIRPDPLGIGIDVDDRDCAGEGLWALGPLSKARRWEIIAVPDIRGQCEAVAEAIAAGG